MIVFDRVQITSEDGEENIFLSFEIPCLLIFTRGRGRREAAESVGGVRVTDCVHLEGVMRCKYLA